MRLIDDFVEHLDLKKLGFILLDLKKKKAVRPMNQVFFSNSIFRAISAASAAVAELNANAHATSSCNGYSVDLIPTITLSRTSVKTIQKPARNPLQSREQKTPSENFLSLQFLVSYRMDKYNSPIFASPDCTKHLYPSAFTTV